MKPKFHIVLVRPIYATNIGFAARVCGNMGIDGFVVISQEDLHLKDDAKKRAAGAQKHLKKIRVYPNLEDFYKKEGEGLRIGFTRRGGKNRPVPYIGELINDEFKSYIKEESIQDIYLFFGPEDDGLSADDLKNVQLHAQLPTYGDMGSLNLAHATLLASFILQDKWGTDTVRTPTNLHEKELEPRSLEYDDAPLKAWLQNLGMEETDSNKSAARGLHKMILRSLPTKREMRIWHNVLNSTVRLLKKLKEEDRRQR